MGNGYALGLTVGNFNNVALMQGGGDVYARVAMHTTDSSTDLDVKLPSGISSLRQNWGGELLGLSETKSNVILDIDRYSNASYIIKY